MSRVIKLPAEFLEFLFKNNLSVIDTKDYGDSKVGSSEFVEAQDKLNRHFRERPVALHHDIIEMLATNCPPRNEYDPNGIAHHSPGAKLDAGKVRPSLIFNDMPRALLAVANVATFGANKYSDGGWQHVPNAIKRYTDAMDRHRLMEFIEGPTDRESGLPHAAHLAWNALAALELMLRDLEVDAE